MILYFHGTQDIIELEDVYGLLYKGEVSMDDAVDVMNSSNGEVYNSCRLWDVVGLSNHQ